jgi:hypothetical protein
MLTASSFVTCSSKSGAVLVRVLGSEMLLLAKGTWGGFAVFVAAAGFLSKVWPQLSCIMNLWCSAFNRMGLLCQCLCVRSSLS